MLETFAKIAHSENDLRRSVNCYTEIVSFYQQQQAHKDRRNEVRFAMSSPLMSCLPVCSLTLIGALDHLRVRDPGHAVCGAR